MMIPVRNAAIALVVHVVALFIMMVVFKWGIYAVVVSKIVFSACTCISNRNHHFVQSLQNCICHRRQTVENNGNRS